MVFANTEKLGWELLNGGAIIHAWNTHNHYYFDSDTGIQLTNHYEEYWTHNVMMLGYYTGSTWNLIYRTDALSGFTREFEGTTDDYMQLTLWKNLSYGSYSFRLAIRYKLGVDDQNLTIIPYIKNLGAAIPYTLGFGWELKDIKVGNSQENNQIRINNTSYLLNQSLNNQYINITKTEQDVGTHTGNNNASVLTNSKANWTTNQFTGITLYNITDGSNGVITANTQTTVTATLSGGTDNDWDIDDLYHFEYQCPSPIFYLDLLKNGIIEKVLYLQWNKNLDYVVSVKSRTGQYNAPVTLFIRVGTLAVNQEKYTTMNWFDSDTLYEYYNTSDDSATELYTNVERGQGFTIGNVGTNVAFKLTSVKLKLYKQGTGNTITANLYADDGTNRPTGASLSNGSIDGSGFAADPGAWYEITMTPYVVTVSTKYILVCTGNGNSTNKSQWRMDTTSPTYGGGQICYRTAPGAWNLIAWDGMFEIYGLVGTAYSTTDTEKLGLKDIAVCVKGTLTQNWVVTDVEKIGFIDTPSHLTHFIRTDAELIGLLDGETDVYKGDKTFSEKIGLTDTATDVTNFKPVVAEKIGLLDSSVTGVHRVSTDAELVGLLDAKATLKVSVSTAVEKLGLLDAEVDNAKFIRTAAELLGLKDTATDVEQYIRTAAEIIGLKDIGVGDSGNASTINELLGLKDLETTVATRSRTFTELLGLKDSYAYKTTFARTFNELLGLLDAIQTVARKTSSSAELLGLKDIATPTATHSRTSVELLGLLDAFSKKTSFIRTVNELLGLTDIRIMKMSKNVAELIGLLDISTTSANLTKTITVAEKLGIHDFTFDFPFVFPIQFGRVTERKYGRTSAELLGLKDGFTEATTFARSTSETIGLLDAMQTKETIVRTFIELLGLKDTIATVLNQGKSTTVNETLGLLDANLKNLKHAVISADLLGLKDIGTTATQWNRTAAELIGLLDSIQSVHAHFLTMSELLGAKDVSATVTRFVATCADKLGLLDSYATKSVYAKTLSELLGLKDTGITYETFDKTFAEKIGLLDTAIPETVSGKQASAYETLGLADSFAETGVFHITSAELLGLLDSIITMHPTVITEIIGLKDLKATSAYFVRSYSELLGLLDAKMANMVGETTAVETLGLKDTTGTVARFATSSTEVIGIKDTIATVTRFTKTISESIGLLDKVGIPRWFVDIEKMGLLEAATALRNYTYVNIGYLFEVDVYY